MNYKLETKLGLFAGYNDTLAMKNARWRIMLDQLVEIVKAD